MIKSFADHVTEEIYNGVNSKLTQKCLDPTLYPIARRKLDMLDAAKNLNDLKVPPGNRLEALKGDLQGQYSIRINDQYRIIFFWGIQGPEEVQIVDYHRG